MNPEYQNSKLESQKAGAYRLAILFLLIGLLTLIGFGSFILNMTINFFEFVSTDQEKWAARKELVASGKIPPLGAKVVGKRYEKDTITTGTLTDRTTRTTHRHWVEIEIETIGPLVRDVPKKAFERIVEGQKIQVYPVDETYFIPAFKVEDTGQTIHIAKLIFLSLSSLPLLAGIIGLCFVIVKIVRHQLASYAVSK